MKITDNILVLFLISFNLFSQNNFNDLGQREGVWYGYHENGRIKYQGEFKNGKEVGVFKYFDLSSNLAVKLQYLDIGVTSSAIIYYPNGSIKSEGLYVNKQKHGVWSYYNNAGNKTSKENYIFGTMHGDVIYYNENGFQSEKYHYLMGVKSGEASIFYRSGFLNVLCNYLNDTLHGSAKFYYDNKLKQLESEGFYNYGIKDSIWFFYNENGDIIKKETYNLGVIVPN